MLSKKIFVTGCDSNTEWQLKWFLENYRKHNTLPIAIADLGMSDEMLSWCDNNFDIIIDATQQTELKSWFAKPMVMKMLSEKYEEHDYFCWLDTDCQVVDDISDIFDYIRYNKLTISKDLPWTTRRPGNWFNSGVVAFMGWPNILDRWYNSCKNLIKPEHEMYGDQDILCEMLDSDKAIEEHIYELPNKYNVLRLQHQDNTVPDDVKIYHWTGKKGNEVIKGMIKPKRINVIGNGDHAFLYNEDKNKGGLNLICNMPPFEITNVYASVMVDFKMMSALTEGSLNLNMYPWVLGTRPKKWMELKPTFYLKYAQNIKDFYQVVPKYAGNATAFNCGHMAVHYACNKLQGTEVHMYGFDSMFDANVRSITDLYLNSDRSESNNFRLMELWRPIWLGIFNEFPNTTFVLHHKHSNIKFKVPKNVRIETHGK